MSSEEHDALDGMSSEFISEIKEDLASLETDLLAMEENKDAVDEQLVNHAFRSIHSIKGGAGFLNFTELSRLSHVMESVLMRIREKEIDLTSNAVDALLLGFDKMKSMADTIGQGREYDISDQMNALERILGVTSPVGKRPLEKEPQPCETVSVADGGSRITAKQFVLDKEKLEKALSDQKYLYAVFLRSEQDIAGKNRPVPAVIEEIREIGELLFSDHENPKSDEGFYCVIATILDPPLLVQVLEIEKEQLALLDRQFTDCRSLWEAFKNGPAPVVEEDNPKKDPDFLSREASPSSFFPNQTIRINVDLISKLMNRAGELVLSRNQLRPVMEGISTRNSHAHHVMQQLDMVSTDIQESIMQMRMQPVIDLLGKYKRVVRDISRRMSKKIAFVVEGAGVEADRNILEMLANPMTHLIRNCIDHGIELPEIRKKLGKPETGTIKIKAFHQGGHVHIDISDDGAGIDPQLILSKAFEKKLVTEEQVKSLKKKQKINLIFLPGFSTTEAITDISGRGVGMDVVKTNIEQLRGRIEIDSQKGKGTTVHLIIPLTLAIVPSLVIGTGDHQFAIPRMNIKEVIHLESGKIHPSVEFIGGCEVFRLRGELLPILRLRNVLGIQTCVRHPETGEKIVEQRKALADRRRATKDSAEREKRLEEKDRRKETWDETYVIILKIGNDRFGLCVDDLNDIEEVVVEPLSDYIKHLKMFSGATILGDGNVIMVLDIPGIAKASSLRFEIAGQNADGPVPSNEEEEKQQYSKKNYIVCANGPKEFFALPLEDISRIEPVLFDQIHYTGSFKHIEYKKTSAILFSPDELFPAAGYDKQEKHDLFVLFLKRQPAAVGMIASQIVDTMEIRVIKQKDPACPNGVKANVFIDDMMVQILDYEALSTIIQNRVSSFKTGMETDG